MRVRRASALVRSVNRLAYLPKPEHARGVVQQRLAGAVEEGLLADCVQIAQLTPLRLVLPIGGYLPSCPRTAPAGNTVLWMFT